MATEDSKSDSEAISSVLILGWKRPTVRHRLTIVDHRAYHPAVSSFIQIRKNPFKEIAIRTSLSSDSLSHQSLGHQHKDIFQSGVFIVEGLHGGAPFSQLFHQRRQTLVVSFEFGCDAMVIDFNAA